MYIGEQLANITGILSGNPALIPKTEIKRLDWIFAHGKQIKKELKL